MDSRMLKSVCGPTFILVYVLTSFHAHIPALRHSFCCRACLALFPLLLLLPCPAGIPDAIEGSLDSDGDNLRDFEDPDSDGANASMQECTNFCPRASCAFPQVDHPQLVSSVRMIPDFSFHPIFSFQVMEFWI